MPHVDSPPLEADAQDVPGRRARRGAPGDPQATATPLGTPDSTAPLTAAPAVDVDADLDPKRWRALAVIALAQFMVVLDVTIVNVALPDIQRALHFSTDGLQWVINAYTLMFGGFLLLGGRIADLAGRRRTFLAGLTLFAGASLVAGLSSSDTMLIAARVVQGLGAAALSPAALAILTVTFPHGKERNVAMGVWGALAGLGGTLGVIAGGILVDAFGWEWIFFVNLPMAAVVLVAAPRLVRETKSDMVERQFDVAGAVLGTAGVLAMVFGVIRTQTVGWGSAQVLGLFALAVVLMAAFVRVELRAKAPLVPMRLFRSRGLSVSSATLAVNGSVFLAMFFLTALYLQEVRGDSPLDAGLHFVPMGIAAIASAIIASNLVTRIGTKPVFIAGAVLSVAGLFLLSGASADGSYWTTVMPGTVVYGFGLSLVGVPNQISAIMEVDHRDAGAASAVINAMFQIGGALGLAVITTFANTHVAHRLAAGATQSHALVDGYQLGLVIAAGLAVVNVLIAATIAPSEKPTEEQLAGAVAA
ncbi:MAG: MFS transporter [Patulibacter sp.]|nr:MFS transporter [Patulibacter sp.]